MKLAIILLEESRFVEAVAEIGRALEIERKGPSKFQPGAASSAHYLLGVAFARQNKFPEARNSLQYALAIDPNNKQASELLRQLPQ